MWTLRAGVAAFAVVLAAGTLDAESPTVTFDNQVVRLFQQNCQTCHRPDDIAPFPLLTYEDARRRQDRILRAVESRTMPPWKAVPGFGDFLGSRRLSDSDVALVRAWVDGGAPEGDPRDLPPPRTFPDTWSLGQPDAILAPAEAFQVPSGGQDVYRCFVIRTRFAEDRYLSAVEYVPGNRTVVHHVLTYLDTAGRADALAHADSGSAYPCFGGPGFSAAGSIGGWAPGSPPTVMPEGVGMLLPVGARVVLQVHYHNRTGVTHSDLTRVGLHFARTPIDKRYRSIPIWNTALTIPAGAARHEVRASWTVPARWNLHAIGVFPHMHLLGRQMVVTATYADGTVRPLIRIDDWDFHWQGGYDYAQPVPLPGGTRIDLVAVYDNSEGNRRNPNHPPKDVSWGENTTDEMCIAFLRVTVDAEQLGYRPPAEPAS